MTNISHFEFVKKLGSGGFGSVHLVINKKETKKRAFALKCVKKRIDRKLALNEREVIICIIFLTVYLKFFLTFRSEYWRENARF